MSYRFRKLKMSGTCSKNLSIIKKRQLISKLVFFNNYRIIIVYSFTMISTLNAFKINTVVNSFLYTKRKNNIVINKRKILSFQVTFDYKQIRI